MLEVVIAFRRFNIILRRPTSGSEGSQVAFGVSTNGINEGDCRPTDPTLARSKSPD